MKTCPKCKGTLDAMDIKFGCLRCKIRAENEPRNYTKKEKKFFEKLERSFKIE